MSFQPQQTTFVYAQPQTFPDEYASKYRCCCCTSVSVGAMIIAIIQIIGCSITLIYSFAAFAVFLYATEFFISTSVVTIIFTIAQIIVACLMLYGISRINHKYVLPAVIFQGIGLICIVIGIIAVIIILSMSDSIADNLCNDNPWNCYSNNGYYESINYDFFQAVVITYGVVVVIFLFIALPFSIWFFVVILRCYQYIKAKSHWQHSHPMAAVNVSGYQAQYATPQYATPQYATPQYVQQPGVGYAPQSGMAYTQQSNMPYNPQSNNMVYNPSGQPYMQQNQQEAVKIQY